ncbi:MAG: DUF4202 domain-containing protein, partial [Hyphomicrobiales bacterium]
MTEKLTHVLKLIDDANRADPTIHIDDEGVPHPEAYLYGQRMSSELDRLCGNTASDVLRIAARGQHIERWQIKRAQYPEGRTGYLTWRRDQAQAHGDRLAGFMQDANYTPEDCERVRILLRKEGLKRDAEVQQLEDIICFTFIKWYFKPFAEKHPDEKVLDIVAKTARKMSTDARTRALAEFDLPDALR